MTSRTLLAAALSFAMPLSAHAAASTSTPPIRVQGSLSHGIWCGATNVTTKPVEMSVDVIDQTGAVYSPGGLVTVAPGATTGSALASSSMDGFFYCRANGLSNKKVHVTTCLVTLTTVSNGSGECLATTTNP
jgi:hypothetical protein